MLGPFGRALARYHHRTVHVPRVRRLVDALSEQIGTADSLLDVGCGDGTIARHVGQRVGARRVAGVDVLLRPEVAIDAVVYDGLALPFEDESFEIVTLVDVLHHAAEPLALLRECLRVARRAVTLKDHFAFGPVSHRLLLAMDQVGNAAAGVTVRGNYLRPPQWIALVREADGVVTSLRWPLRIHDLPWRVITRSELQFAAMVEPRPGHDATEDP